MDDKKLVDHIGKQLRARRSMLGLSQEDVGNGLGIAAQQVQKYERGINVVNAVRLYQFSRFLRVPISYFYQDFDDGTAKDDKHGFAEESAVFEGRHKTTSDRETLELTKSFKHIKDRALRKRFADLLRTMSQKDI